MNAKNMKEESKFNNVTNRLTQVLFIIYLMAICWILLFKLGVRFSYMGKRSVNLIPFSESLILDSENILNVLVFVPLGIYAGILFERWVFGKKLLLFFLLSSIVEGLQYILGVGVFDVTDIITNTLGGVVGLIIFKAIDKSFNNSVKAQKFVNIIATTGTVLMILLLVLLKMNMLPVRYQ
jgi:glycopeptide antibiotics resistance protein